MLISLWIVIMWVRLILAGKCFSFLLAFEVLEKLSNLCKFLTENFGLLIPCPWELCLTLSGSFLFGLRIYLIKLSTEETSRLVVLIFDKLYTSDVCLFCSAPVVWLQANK